MTRNEALEVYRRNGLALAQFNSLRADIAERLIALENERDAALARVRELTEWRPMETAPKGIAAEGPLVILSDGRGTEVTGFWGAGVWVTGLGPYFQPVAWLPLPEPPKEDARREGVASRDEFAALWDSLAKPGTSWADNPWVWRVGFSVEEVKR